jgi:hypothetical protein
LVRIPPPKTQTGGSGHMECVTQGSWSIQNHFIAEALIANIQYNHCHTYPGILSHPPDLGPACHKARESGIHKYMFVRAIQGAWSGAGREQILFRWRNPHQSRYMFLDLRLGMVILFLDLCSYWTSVPWCCVTQGSWWIQIIS